MEPHRTLEIESMSFLPIFGRDSDYDTRTWDFEPYLDLETGEVLEIGGAWADEEQDEEKRQRVEAAPQRYLELRGLDHSEHHEILQLFLESEWTADEELRRTASAAYDRSIGGWKDRVAQSTWYAFDEFRNRELEKRAEIMLREHGIAPKWC